MQDCYSNTADCLGRKHCGDKISWLDIMVITLVLIISFGTDVSFEFLWKTNEWKQESFVSSGVAAVASFFISFLLYNSECAKTDAERNSPSSYLAKLILSEIVSSAALFGIGVLADYIVEVTGTHETIDSNAVNSIPIAIATTSAKSLSRLGVFAALNYAKKIVCPQNRVQSDEEITLNPSVGK